MESTVKFYKDKATIEGPGMDKIEEDANMENQEESASKINQIFSNEGFYGVGQKSESVN